MNPNASLAGLKLWKLCNPGASIEHVVQSWLFFGLPLTLALLRLDRYWDPLRSDARFQCCAKKNQSELAQIPDRVEAAQQFVTAYDG